VIIHAHGQQFGIPELLKEELAEITLKPVRAEAGAPLNVD